MSRFACAFIDAMLLTTENEAMERFLLEFGPASLRADPVGDRDVSDGEVIGTRLGFFKRGTREWSRPTPQPRAKPTPRTVTGEADAVSGSRH